MQCHHTNREYRHLQIQRGGQKESPPAGVLHIGQHLIHPVVRSSEEPFDIRQSKLLIGYPCADELVVARLTTTPMSTALTD